METAKYALGEHPHKMIRVPNTGIVVSGQGYKSGIEQIIVPKLTKVVGKGDIVRIKNNSQGTPVLIEWRTGSITHLMSAEQDDDVFEGTTVDYAWLDEPMRREIFIALKRGMLTTGGHLWMTCTPLDEPWIYEELYTPSVSGLDPDTEVFEGTSDENIAIEEVEKLEFKKRLTEDEIETRWFGKFKHLAGRVFKSYNPEVHLIEPFDIPSHWPVYCAIDPHRNKAHAVVWLAVSPQNKYFICNEIYKKCSITELAAYILNISSQYSMVKTLIDTSAQEEGWTKDSARELLRDAGVPTRLAQKKNLKKSGILIINQAFSDNNLFIFKTCKRAHRELTNQIYVKNKRDSQQLMEEPQKKWDDITDGIRYIVVERPRYTHRGIVTVNGPVLTRGR